jgi:ATP-dependent DNA helicase RecG
LSRHLAQAEVVYEYRLRESSIAYQQRREYRAGFFLFQDDLWEQIDRRNEVFHYQDRFFVGDVPTFNELVVREGLLNAISHRDYRLPGSTFVRQYPKLLEVVSPGGFPPGITAENILWRQSPRNRRIAEVFQKCGLVERSGQGANRMFEVSIKEGKRRPDYSGTDEYQVCLTLHGDVQDPRFLRFFEAIGKERLAAFILDDLLVVDLIHRDQPVPAELRDRISRLKELGVIESRGQGKNVRYMLSRRFYGFMGQPGTYTHRRGLDREANKALLLSHLEASVAQGCPLSELAQVLPALSQAQIRGLLRDLKQEGRAHSRGRTRAGRWFPGPEPTY